MARMRKAGLFSAATLILATIVKGPAAAHTGIGATSGFAAAGLLHLVM